MKYKIFIAHFTDKVLSLYDYDGHFVAEGRVPIDLLQAMTVTVVADPKYRAHSRMWIY